MLNRQGRPTAAGEAVESAPDTFSGNRGLSIEEALIFEIGRTDTTGVDLEEPAKFAARLGKLARTEPIGLPGLSEPEAMRHYVRLSQKNYGIDTGLFPLGSCTMKHNPRLNERMARLPGFGDIHPLQPLSTVPGAIALIAELSRWLSRADGHAGHRHDAQGRRPRRARRHDGHQGGAGGARREAPDRAGAGVRARHQPGDRGAARLSHRGGAGARRRHGRSRGGEEAALSRGRRHHADQPQHLRPVRARRRGHRRGRARGRRLLLRRRRQLQCHRRQGAPRRSRRRRHAHQPAQDLLHPARRRRPRRRSRGAVGGAGAVHAGALHDRRRRRRALCGAHRPLPPCGGGTGRGGSQNICHRGSPHP